MVDSGGRLEQMLAHIADRNSERVDPGRILRTVDNVRSKFEVPAAAVERAMRSEVWVMDRETFGEYTEYYLESIGMSPKEEFGEVEVPREIAEVMEVDINQKNRERRRRLEVLRGHIGDNQAMALRMELGNTLILINRNDCKDGDEALTHELVHAMMEERPREWEEEDGNERGGFRKKTLNEAVVQLITLCCVDREKLVGEVLKEVAEGKKKVGYAREMQKLTLLLGMMSGGVLENLHKVVRLYFDEEMSPVEKEWLLKMDVYRGLPDRLAGENGFKDKGIKVFDSI